MTVIVMVVSAGLVSVSETLFAIPLLDGGSDLRY